MEKSKAKRVEEVRSGAKVKRKREVRTGKAGEDRRSGKAGKQSGTESEPEKKRSRNAKGKNRGVETGWAKWKHGVRHEEAKAGGMR